MKDIDGLWAQYNLYQYIPAPFHYTAVGIATALPFILVCTLLCCLFEDDEAPAKPNYSAGAQKSASPKKGGAKPEKLD